MTETTNSYGLLLRTEHLHGNPYLIAEIVKREGEHHAPRNVSDGLWVEAGRPKHLDRLALGGLQMRGFVSDSQSPALIGWEPGYYNVYHVGQGEAEKMARTLALITKRARADAAYNAVDALASLCAALRLSFIVECKEDRARSSYDENRWHWMTVGEGRNRYRQLIDALIQQRTIAA